MKKATKKQIAKEIAWFGDVLAVYSVGEYQFVEYRNTFVCTGSTPEKTEDYGKTRYTSFHLGKKIPVGWKSLEAAMAGTMAWVKDDPNSQAGKFFCRMLKID